MKFYQLSLILLLATALQALRNVILTIADDLGTDYLGFYEDHAFLKIKSEQGEISRRLVVQ